MIKLSKPSKMPCKSWSLQALETCPASKKPSGELVDACKGCYATTGNYRFPNVKAPRISNKEDWKRDDWSQDMIQELDTERYFRWFDSGDLYSLKLAEKILEVMKATPWCKHWLPTRMYKLAKFTQIIAKMNSLDNVVIRLSGDEVLGQVIEGAQVSAIAPILINTKIEGKKVSTLDHDAVSKYITKDMTICPAYKQGGKCKTCRSCWSKTTKITLYPAHGVQMLNVIKTLNVA
tara:strand:+ start:445 stop:1146 length:702 start_codon:yes stop_codon:yes gene_type:complete